MKELSLKKAMEAYKSFRGILLCIEEQRCITAQKMKFSSKDFVQ